jgi:hypothetical protein
MGGHVTHLGKKRGVHAVLARKPRKGNNLDDKRIDKRIILKRFFKKLDGMRGLD